MPLTSRRLSLILSLGAPAKSDNAVDGAVKPKKSVPNMSGDTSSPTPKGFPSVPTSWPLSRKQSRHSLPIRPGAPASSHPDAKENMKLSSKARDLGKLVGEVISRGEEENELLTSGETISTPKDTPRTSAVRERESSSSVSRSPSMTIRSASGIPGQEHAVGHLSSQSKTSLKLPESVTGYSSGSEQNNGSSHVNPSMKISPDPDMFPTKSHAPDAEEQQKASLRSLSHPEESVRPKIVLEGQSTPSSRQPLTTKGHDERKQRRIKSVDLSAITKLRRTPSTSTISQRQGSRDSTVKRSRSLWTGMIHAEKQKISGSPGESTYEQKWADKRDPEKPMSERQRSLNVKRARKMAQMFGSEPPPGLFLVDKDDDNDNELLSEENRRSIATLLSLSSVDLSSIAPTHVRVDSTGSAGTAAESAESTECPEETTSDPAALPPFANLVHSVSGLQAISPATSPQGISVEPVASFRERRRRAAKLSRFFGVGYQDLTSTLCVEDLPIVSKLTRTSSESIEDKNVAVDVRVSGRGRFWGLSDGPRRLQNADVVDVIDKLRGLRAA